MNAFEAAEKNGKSEELKDQLVALAQDHNKGGSGRCRFPPRSCA